MQRLWGICLATVKLDKEVSKCSIGSTRELCCGNLDWHNSRLIQRLWGTCLATVKLDKEVSKCSIGSTTELCSGNQD